MTAFGGIKNKAKVNIIVSLRSLLLCESLCRAISRDVNGYKTTALPGTRATADFKPDLILVDACGLSEELYLKWPDSRVLLIDTGLSETDTVRLMRTFKLYGVISPDEDFHQFKKALNVIQDGQIWLDNSKLKAVLHGKDCECPESVTERPSKKEARIIDLVAEGYKNKEIASMLFLSEQTIKSHLCRIFKKMHVKNRSQLVSLVIKKKMLDHQSI
jgi:DNA-binding NarL/FixJ family response regulator